MVDILLPTQGLRPQGLKYQVLACAAQSYSDVHVTVLNDSDMELHNIMDMVADGWFGDKVEIKEVPPEWRGQWGHRPIRWAIENLDLGEWFLTTGDDDAIMPWAVEKLAEQAVDGIDMVIGKCLPVKRNFDTVKFILGEEIAFRQITGSCCMYRTSRVKELGYDDSRYEADWDLIAKMLKYPYCVIDTVLFVMPQSFP